MVARRLPAALTLPLALLAAVPAAAQTSGAALLRPMEAPSGSSSATRSTLPDFTGPEGDLRRGGDIRRSGLIAAYQIAPNVQVGVGRFSVPELARPRTHMERDRNPTAVRSRDRGIAAVGFSLSF